MIYAQKMIKTANIYLENLNKWLKCWRLKVSAPKCSYTIFSNGPYKDKETFILKLAGDKRLSQLFERYINSTSNTNPLIKQLINEYNDSFTSIIKNNHSSTPLTYIFNFIVHNTIQNLVESIEATSNNDKTTNTKQTTSTCKHKQSIKTIKTK